jgi:hypothetical protein
LPLTYACKYVYLQSPKLGHQPASNQEEDTFSSIVSTTNTSNEVRTLSSGLAVDSWLLVGRCGFESGCCYIFPLTFCILSILKQGSSRVEDEYKWT